MFTCLCISLTIDVMRYFFPLLAFQCLRAPGRMLTLPGWVSTSTAMFSIQMPRQRPSIGEGFWMGRSSRYFKELENRWRQAVDKVFTKRPATPYTKCPWPCPHWIWMTQRIPVEVIDMLSKGQYGASDMANTRKGSGTDRQGGQDIMSPKGIACMWVRVVSYPSGCVDRMRMKYWDLD